MKKIFAFIFSLVLGSALYAQTTNTDSSQPDPNAPAFKFTEETFDFGSIPQGTPAPHSFTYTNVGKSPLIISTVDKSCGCTTPTWSSEPVLPGKTGTVTATYNAAAPGAFTKSVTIHSNATEPTKTLFIKGTVIAVGSDNPNNGTPLPTNNTPQNTKPQPTPANTGNVVTPK